MQDGVVEPIYLGPATPRWSPSTAEDIASAVAAGLLDETHYLELKRQVPLGKQANRELARDLASLAIDGGTLLIGMEENTHTRTLQCAPQPLEGLRQRVESIARAIPDPPLTVVVRAIGSEDDPRLGYLVVHVPSSVSAPHMVDHKYLGRGDTQKCYLSDPEVLRLHQRRRRQEEEVLEWLAQEFARDPVPVDEQKQAHLFLLAEPLTPREGMLLPHLHHQDLLTLIITGAYGEEAVRAVGPGDRFAPDVAHVAEFSPRSLGAALSTSQLRSDRTVDMSMTSPEDIIELEVREDGGIRIMMGRLSDAPDSDAQQFLLEAGAVIYVRRLLGLLLEISACTGYLGGWTLGMGASGLRGLSSHNARPWSAFAFEDATYRQAAQASYADLISTPGSIADRLLGRFLRKLGTYSHYSQQLSNPPTPENEDGGKPLS